MFLLTKFKMVCFKYI